MFTLVLVDEFLDRFSKFRFFIVRNLHFNLVFLLSMHGNVFIAHWAYEERISSHTEHTPNEFSRMLSQRSNFDSFYIRIHAKHKRKRFHRMVSICGNDFIAHWAYSETISSHAEHTPSQYNATNCLEKEDGIQGTLTLENGKENGRHGTEK